MPSKSLHWVYSAVLGAKTLWLQESPSSSPAAQGRNAHHEAADGDPQLRGDCGGSLAQLPLEEMPEIASPGLAGQRRDASGIRTNVSEHQHASPGSDRRPRLKRLKKRHRLQKMPDALPDTGLQHSSSATHDSDGSLELDAAMATHADELGHSRKPSTVAGVSDTDTLRTLAEQASSPQHHANNGLAQLSSHERSPIEGVTGDQIQPVGVSAAQRNALAAIRARRTNAEETYGDRLGGCPVLEQGTNATCSN